jgi:hypothetical protein
MYELSSIPGFDQTGTAIRKSNINAWWMKLVSLTIDRALGATRPKSLEIDMTAAIARLLPRASATSVANIGAFVTVALFSGLGLLLSL